jgi:hypothetical protein
MAVNLSPVGGVAAQFFDNSGNVLTGGKLLTYLAGTTTPAVTYTTSAGTIPQPNPIILNASGRVPGSGEIWLTDGILYKFVLTDSNDVLIATYDNITGINSNFVNFTNQQEIQTATAGQTVFNLTTVQYLPGTNSLTVFVDGVNQYGPGAQYAYIETDADTVTFVNGLHVGALVKFTTSQLNSSGAVDAQQVSYDPPFVNSVPTNVEAKLAQTVSVKDFGAVGDGVTDDTIAIQNAVNQSANKELFFPPGNYLITSQINILTRVSLTGAGKNQVTILLGTQNQNGFVVGDGTLGTRGNCGNVSIENIDFNPKNGVAAFASGACIFLNYVFGTKIQYCTVYGRDSTANKLYNGIVAFQVIDYLINYCNFSNLLGYGHTAEGTSPSLQTINSRLDFCQFVEIGLDCVYFGDYTEGMTINCMIAYQYTGAGIRIEATPINRNIFILQPDLEVSGSAVGIYVDGGANVNIVGGWIGGTANVGLYVNTGSSGVYAIGVIFGQSTITLKDAACQIVGCDIAGNSVTPSTGITIWGAATGTVISGNSIRQWPTNGIEFTTGNAARTNISGNNFNGNGVDILGGNWSPATASPANISGNTTDFAFAITAASSITLTPTKTFYQVTGVTAINTINSMATSVQIVIQAGTGGITLNSGTGNLTLKGGVNASVPAFGVITLISEGTSWIELSRGF